MSIKVTRTALGTAVTRAGRQPPAMLPDEYAGRLWLLLNGSDPGGVPALTAGQLDALALEKAREIILRRYAGQELGSADAIARQLSRWRDGLTGE